MKKVKKRSIFTLGCLLLLWSVLMICADPFAAKVSATTTNTASSSAGSETKQLPDKIRTMSYYGYNKVACAVYPSWTSKKTALKLAKNSKFEIVDKKSQYNRCKIIYNKKYYYIPYNKVKYNGCNYTKKKYTTQQKLNFVQKYSSKTKYLIWISHYTQQVNIFQGKKGHWKLIKTYLCTTGGYTHRSPHGVYKLYKKRKTWTFSRTYVKYVSFWMSENSFHSRIYRKASAGGGCATPKLGSPGSSGCIRLYDEDCYYIYKNMPMGTTVISY